MRVKAKFPANKFGFYGGKRRYNGDEFVLASDAHFSEKWMISLELPKDADEVEKPRRGRKPKEAIEAEEGAE